MTQSTSAESERLGVVATQSRRLMGIDLAGMFDSSGASIALRSVLDLEIFRRAEAFIAAGEHDVDRPVRWVHAAEIADIAQFLSGGELLLTAGQGLGHSETEQRAYLRSIAQVGVAGLAVELTGRHFDDFPAAVVDEANLLGVPLIGLRHEVPFVEASAQVLELLTEEMVRENARTVDVNRVLTERLVAGADHISLVRTISENVGRPVVLESADHELQAFYGDESSSEPMLADWRTHARARSLHDLDSDTGPRCLRRPIVMQGATWGYLHMSWDDGCTHIDQIVIEHGASAIAISLLNERVSGARSRHQQGILVNRLMLGDISGRGFVDRALRLGKDLRTAELIVAMIGTDDESVPDLERQVSADVRGVQLDAVTADINGAVLSIVALRDEKSVVQLTRALRSDSRYLGLSKVVTPEDLPAALQQARAAFFARQPCQLFDELGILRLLVPLSHGPDLASYVEDELGALLEYDQHHDSQLFSTLVAFLHSDANKTIAAKELFVQRRTLYYRLEKVSQILGLDLEDVEVRLRLQVAIRAADFLRNSRGVRTWNA